MGGDQTELQGPDLAAGVPLPELADGKPLLGHVAGESVVVVRRGDEVFAIGATCTHYGGPLAEGLVEGDTVICPWHHACFSLRTGEATCAPALNPVARWTVELRDGMASVGDRIEEDALASHGRDADGPESVVIIGAGAAGSAAAEMLRREGYGGPISLIDPDEDAPYDRPNLSKDYLAGNAPEEWLPLRPGDFYSEHGIDRVVESVESIDAHGRAIQLSSGRTMAFGALLLATGSSAIKLKIPGADLPHVHVLRSLADCRAIIARLAEARRAVVLGASFIGMEVAAALRARGLEVTVVAPEEVPFSHSLGPALGKLLRETHEKHGTRFVLGRTAATIGRDHVQLDNEARLLADLVVVGVGVRPDTTLAEAVGLEVDNGIAVNEMLETSTPGIYAAGDIARYPAPRTGEPTRVEHWVHAQRQGQAAARNILGQRKPYFDPPFFWTNQWEVGINYVGYPAKWDDVKIDGDLSAGDAAVHYSKGGEVVAMATLGRDLESLQKEAAMARSAAVRS